MKKNYISKLLIVCVFFCTQISAQLSGVYTINNGLATGGTNYASFTAFAAAINASGVSGPVIVNVNPTTAYVEQVNFNQFTGSSATNTVTINGNGATLTFNATGAPHTLMLSGADFMFFNNLNVIGTNATLGLAIHLWNDANDNYFLNCSAILNGNWNSTSSSQVPLSISGNQTSATTSGIAGNRNTFDGCTVRGGYYNTSFYGNSVSPFSLGNKMINCVMSDYYAYGYFTAYMQNMLVKNNRTENNNRTTVSTRYCFYIQTGCQGSVIDGNRVRDMFLNIPGNAGGIIGFYLPFPATQAQPVIVQNNIVSDNICNGQIIGFYAPSNTYTYIKFFHNTASLDNQGSTYTGTSYGFYVIPAPSTEVRNNICTIGMGGSGIKYCYYYSTGVNIPTSYNVAYFSTTAGTRYAYNYNAINYASLGALLSAYPLAEPGSVQTDPMYNNPTVFDYTPMSLVINNMCPSVGTLSDQLGIPRGPAPDPGALETYTVPCVGSAPANAVLTPTGVLCQNSAIAIQLANSFTNTGYNVQWNIATASILGPYTAISGATLPFYNTNTLIATTFYNVLITCANGGQPVTALAGSVQIATPIINNVPYFEDFEGISKTNQLPNCSWSSSSSFTATLTYTTNGTGNRFPHSGSKFATFANTPAGTNSFYSNGINMITGITYSAALWFINEKTTFNPWADLSILVGTTQNGSGLTPIVSGTAAVLTYSLLSGTFTVPTSGVYYICIRASTATGSSPFLSWDDLSVTIPCQLPANAPPLTLAASAPGVCAGTPVVFTAAGANGYTWSPAPQSGQGQPLISQTPSITTPYSVIGSNTLSGCTMTITQLINVLPSPPVVAFASKVVICEGESTNLTAAGANSYNWSTGGNTQNITVSPNTSTSYSVIGVNLYGCATLQNIVIAVNPLPNVTATTNTMVCKGDQVTMIGNGAAQYQWSASNSVVYFGNPMQITPVVSGAFTVTGTNADGCVGKFMFALDVEECTGINEFNNGLIDITAYPNPNSGVFTIESKQTGVKAIEIYDVTGRNVFSGTMTNNAKINISEMPNGVYSVKVKDGEATKYFKVIKAQ